MFNLIFIRPWGSPLWNRHWRRRQSQKEGAKVGWGPRSQDGVAETVLHGSWRRQDIFYHRRPRPICDVWPAAQEVSHYSAPKSNQSLLLLFNQYHPFLSTAGRGQDILHCRWPRPLRAAGQAWWIGRGLRQWRPRPLYDALNIRYNKRSSSTCWDTAPQVFNLSKRCWRLKDWCPNMLLTALLLSPWLLTQVHYVLLLFNV